MSLSSVNIIYFSPTGTSRTVVRAIGQALRAGKVNEFDITPSNFEFKNIEDELTIIGIPVYRGRVPVDVIWRLRKFKAKNTPVVLVVLYGNRDFDDALLELKELSCSLGFVPLAAAAFIGEHSYSTESTPIAQNRPDDADLLTAKEFAQAILNKMADGKGTELSVSGNKPYKEMPIVPVISPRTIEDKCTLCGICADICPVDVIVLNKTVITNAEACIWCCACVKACPENARIFDPEVIKQIRIKLVENCSERKESEFFI